MRKGLITRKSIELLNSKIVNTEKDNKEINFNSLKEINLLKIIESLEKCSEIISDFFESKGIFKGMFNYFTNDSFGSIYEMKLGLINNYKSIDNYLTTKENNILETYIKIFI